MEALEIVNALQEAIPAELKEEKEDERKNTSPINGLSGGRDFIPVDQFAREFKKDYSEKNGSLRQYRKDWYFFNGKAYEILPETDLENALVRFLQINYANDLRISTTLTRDVLLNLAGICGLHARNKIPFFIDGTNGLNASDWISMNNNLFNIENAVKRINGADISESDIILHHTENLFSTFAIPYDYDPAAECPLFMDYLQGVQPDTENRDVLQMLAGLSLVPETRYEVIFFLYGEAGTGKTVFLNVLENLIGQKNTCCLPLNKFTEKHSTHLLTEKLLNLVGDLPTASENISLHQVEGILKDIASGGILPVERKNKDPLQAPAIARCIFASNSLPAFADRSNGIWDRLRIIPFNQRFRGTEKVNPNLKNDIVRDELPGVFNWAVKGLAKLRKLKRFPDTAEGLKIAEKHRNDCDHEKQFFEESYQGNNGGYFSKAALYKEYRTFCTDNGYHFRNESNFSNAVQRVFPSAIATKKRVSQGNIWVWLNISKKGSL